MSNLCRRTISLLLAAMMLLSLVACGNNANESGDDLASKLKDATENVDTEAANEEVKEEPQEDAADGKPFCVGYWKYDELDVWLIVTDDLRWVAYDASGNATFQGRVEVSGDDYVFNYDDGGEPNTFYKADGGKLIDQDGSTLSRLESLSFAASKDDALTQTANFPGKFESYAINYPEKMVAEPGTELANTLRFSNRATPKGSDDYYSSITVTFQPLVDIDKYMGKGAWLAKPCMGYLVNNAMNTLYGKYIVKSLGTDFQDMGSYYRVTGYMWLDPSFFPNDSAGQDILGVMQMRYYGPTGYGLIAVTVAPVDAIENYFSICMNMLDTCTYKTNWSTAPKVVPKAAGKNRGKAKKAKANPKGTAKGGDPGDYGTAFYWTDEDGDIWYWNGYENVFQSYGSDGYIDDDGEFYESNDAGWTVDNYEDDYDFDPYDSDAGYYYSEDEDVNPFDSDAGGYEEDYGGYDDYSDYDYGGYDDYSDYDYGDDW